MNPCVIDDGPRYRRKSGPPVVRDEPPPAQPEPTKTSTKRWLVFAGVCAFSAILYYVSGLPFERGPLQAFWLSITACLGGLFSAEDLF